MYTPLKRYQITLLDVLSNNSDTVYVPQNLPKSFIMADSSILCVLIINLIKDSAFEFEYPHCF